MGLQLQKVKSRSGEMGFSESVAAKTSALVWICLRRFFKPSPISQEAKYKTARIASLGLADDGMMVLGIPIWLWSSQLCISETCAVPGTQHYKRPMWCRCLFVPLFEGTTGHDLSLLRFEFEYADS